MREFTLDRNPKRPVYTDEETPPSSCRKPAHHDEACRRLATDAQASRGARPCPLHSHPPPHDDEANRPEWHQDAANAAETPPSALTG